MATYQYNAVKLTDKSKIQGTINAETERQARELLREQELYPTSVKLMKSMEKSASGEKKKKEKSALEAWIAEKTSKVGIKEKIAFTQNLCIMVKAGIPITEALLYMESYMDSNPKFKTLLSGLRLDIVSGYSLSRALSKHTDIFNDVYISIVQAGEASGELETILKRLQQMLIDQAKLQKKIIAAMTYPIILVCIVVIVMTLMFIFVIPTFTDIYDNMGVKLPLITQIMVAISIFIRNFWYVAIAMIVGLYYGGKKFITSPGGKAWIDRMLLKIPVVQPLTTSVAASHFLSTLNIAFSAGLPITDCIAMACQTVTNVFLRNAFDEVNLKIQAGQHLASALDEANVLPGMIIIMISTGEQAGSLDQMLDHSLEYLEEEVNQRVDVLMSMMEPLMLLILGGVVGAMALSIYLPLFGMYEHI